MTADGGPRPGYGSDRVVDFLVDAGFPYIALNPGSSFRGLHDSLVNYRDGAPAIIQCTHEKTAVGLAHGYAKASGEPMAVALHDLVGLMHGSMGVYMAYSDRVPIFILGGAGPMDETRRRPWIDWVHSANTQNLLVRDYTKWDDHPYSVAAFGPALARAHRLMLQEPRGPVYVALDAALQEEPDDRQAAADGNGPLPLPSPIGPAPGELEAVVESLTAARRPLVIPGLLGARADTWDDLIALCERFQMAVLEPGLRLSFPNRHPLWVADRAVAGEADLVLLLDVKDPAQKTGLFDTTHGPQAARIRPDATVIDIGLNDVGRGAWTNHDGLRLRADRTITCEGRIAVRELLRLTPDVAPGDRREWADSVLGRRQAAEQRWQERRSGEAGASPVATAVLAAEVWEEVRRYDWVLAAGTLNDWAYRFWDFDRPYRHPGRSLGTATQFPISLGVALAHRGRDRLVVDLQPDGDLLYDLGGLWIARHYGLPLLCVMFNNRAYYNDWAHQIDVARHRSRPQERAWIGMALDGPAPDFATVARGFDWYAEGPISEPGEVRAAVRRAADAVMREQRPALVDVICAPQ